MGGEGGRQPRHALAAGKRRGQPHGQRAGQTVRGPRLDHVTADGDGGRRFRALGARARAGRVGRRQCGLHAAFRVSAGAAVGGRSAGLRAGGRRPHRLRAIAAAGAGAPPADAGRRTAYHRRRPDPHPGAGRLPALSTVRRQPVHHTAA
ncbi:hypothetical protein G6F65_020235 [Rhizopus arrhizus]|nr:hypothetical protein G6F65_020235 [Rhizopus arrhizus]